MIQVEIFLIELIQSKMTSILNEDGVVWQCNVCFYVSKYKHNVAEHIDTKHLESPGLPCSYCDRVCPNKKSLRNHIYYVHKQKLLMHLVASGNHLRLSLAPETHGDKRDRCCNRCCVLRDRAKTY